MNKTRLQYYILAVVVLVLYLLVSYANTQKDEGINWSESYSAHDKIPYGTYVLSESLEDLYMGVSVPEIQETPYTFLELEVEVYPYHTSYLFITSYFGPDDASWDALLDYVYSGNQVFIASNFFSDIVKDSLDFNTRQQYLDYTEDSVKSYFLAPGLSDHAGYNFSKAGFKQYFSEFDTTLCIQLARNNYGQVNLLEIPFGEGSFVLSTTPLAFTNYHLLYTPLMDDFAATALSLLRKTDILYWDEYYKLPSMQRREREQNSLQFIQSEPALRWAFWLMVASLIIYVLFEIKRKQRVIEIVKPLPNTSLEFTETMGRIYFRQQNHTKLVRKKINILLERIRSKFHISTQQLDREFAQKLTAKSGMPLEKVEKLKRLIIRSQKQENASEQDLNDLNQLVEDFYQYMEE